MEGFGFKKVFITGGSKGIGLELVKILLEKGCTVHNVSRTHPPVNHKNLLHYEADLYHSIPEISESFDLAIMNVGTNPGSKKFEDLSEEEISRGIFMNLNIHVILARRLKYRKIVFVDSILSFSGAPYNSLYCASKAFISAFNAALRREGKDTYIVYPYKVNTELFNQIKDFLTIDKAHLAKVIVADIERGTRTRIVPFYFGIIPILECLLPIFVTDWVARTLIRLFTKTKKE